MIKAKFLRDKQIIDVITQLNKHGIARFVGGAVRDALINIQTFDIDIASDLSPEESTNILEYAGYKVIPTGLDHGTITVPLDHYVLEVTTLRDDIETDGRHAKVKAVSSFEQDSNRRDLTINALYADLNGKIYDYHNGVDDLHNGIIKMIGDAKTRFEEDYLRILRALRFWLYYGRQDLDVNTLNAIQICAAGTRQLSKERIREEMRKILSHDNFKAALEIINQYGLTDYLGLKNITNLPTINSWILRLFYIADEDIITNYCLTKFEKKLHKIYLRLQKNIEDIDILDLSECYEPDISSALLASLERTEYQPLLDWCYKNPYPFTGGQIAKQYQLQGAAISMKLLEEKQIWIKKLFKVFLM